MTRFVTEDKGPSWKKTAKQVADHDKQIGQMVQLMHAVTLVVVLMTAALVVSVIGIFVDVWQAKTNAYNDLQEEIKRQNVIYGYYYHRGADCRPSSSVR